MRKRGLSSGAVLAAWALSAGVAFAQAPIQRTAPAAGAVIAAKGGEELQFSAEALWRSVALQQNLVGGDTLRTNASGALGILFQDRTQVRVGRNSTLIVKDVARGPNGETELSLPEGSIYARASRGGSGVTVETPAAAAAIRGTDWSLSVEGAKTSLIVTEGEVVLANSQGSVTVRQGEGAVALIGQAPRKITLINFDGRAQLLLYRELRDSFFELSPNTRPGRDLRDARARIRATPAARRSAEDAVANAELALDFDGAAEAERAVAEAERPGLNAAQRARLTLVRGFIAARRGQWSDAAARFQSAGRNLDAERRDTAAYAAWVSETMARPNERPAPLPEPSRHAQSRAGAIGRASVEMFVESNERGVELLTEAAKRHPSDPFIAAAKGATLLAIDQDKAAKAEIDRALALDPEDPFALAVRARYRWTAQSDLDGAKQDIERAIAAVPGDARFWAELALIEDEREAVREAERAHLRSIELDPQTPLYLANYANFLINRNQIRAAEEPLRRAEAIDPSGAVQLVTRGRLLTRQGRKEDGLQKLLAASAVNPTYVDGLLELAITNYQLGAYDEAAQALDNADRFDDDNPNTPLARSVIAVDQYRADEAIVAARESLRRRLARGGYFATIESDRQNGSPINSALRFLDLDDWGRYFGDRTFDPFSAFGYFDQATSSRRDPFAAIQPPALDDVFGSTAFSSQLQGIMLEPLAVAGSERRQMLTHAPFAEAAIEGGLRSERGDIGWRNTFVAQGKLLEPTPVAVYVTGGLDRPDSSFDDDRNDLGSLTAFIGAQPTLFDNVVLYGAVQRPKQELRTVDLFSQRPERVDSDARTAGVGWTHTFAERNLFQVLISGSRLDRTQAGDSVTDIFDVDFNVRPDGLPDIFHRRRAKGHEDNGVAALAHMIGFGDVTLKYGVEGSISRAKSVEDRFYPGSAFPLPYPDTAFDVTTRVKGEIGLAYADAVWETSPSVQFEAGVFATSVDYKTTGFDCTFAPFLPCAAARLKQRDRDLNPRIGTAWEPVRGHWLRVAYREDVAILNNASLAPVATVGILPNETPAPVGAEVKTFAARWDAEWSPHLFTSLEYQDQRADQLGFGIPESVFDATRADVRLRRLEASANLWLTHGVGLFARYARTWADAAGDADVPFLAEHAGRVGVTFVHPSKVRLSLIQNLVGARDDAGADIPLSLSETRRLKAFTTTDVGLTWEPFDKRLLIGLQAVNLFDRRYVVQANAFSTQFRGLAGETIEGQRRTFLATARVRF
ncbi:FecR domain-containing protein [Methylopila henanensis]|uniref:FecR domain-containing protein n=1 Tax=Methylopila henanensis TaxID=873516 RepID=A0ABW4K1U0_9HYPH